MPGAIHKQDFKERNSSLINTERKWSERAPDYQA